MTTTGPGSALPKTDHPAKSVAHIMKFYPKQLNSLEEVRRERIRLRYEKRNTGLSDLLPFGNSQAGKREKSGSATSGIVNTAMSFMSGGSTLQTILSLAGPLISNIGKRKKPRRFVGNIAKDLIIAYAIGKGAQLAVKGIRSYLKKRKEKQLLAEIATLEARRKR